MNQRSNEEQGPAKGQKGQFRIGGPDEVIYILHQRGDTSQAISERYGLRLEEVEAAIDRCRARVRRESRKMAHE